jgi:uncharacterized protein YbdZ (MbtH family)
MLLQKNVKAALAEGVQSNFWGQRAPYAALLDWHRRHEAWREIAPDPAGWVARVEQKARAKAIEELTGGRGARSSTTALDASDREFFNSMFSRR